MTKLGEQIRQLRRAKKMNQKDLADIVGVTKASISNYETGQRIPPFNVLSAIAKALDVPDAELLSCMAQPVDDGGRGTQNNLPPVLQSGEEPLLLTKMHYAFVRLSDEARKIAVQRIEELSMIPMYQRSLANVLQSYIQKRYSLKYELLEETETQKIYKGSPEAGKMSYEFKRVILKRDINQSVKKIWEFYFYSFNSVGEDDYRYAISLLQDAYEPGSNLGFVFDQRSVISGFYDCYAGKGGTARGHNSQVLFLEVNNDLDITDIMEYDPDR